MPDRPYVVILTGGHTPGMAPCDPSQNDIALILADIGAGAAAELGGQALPVIRAAWARAWADAMRECRVVAVYAVNDPAEAKRLEAVLTREIDPAYMMHTGSPLHEALGCYDEVRRSHERAVRELAALTDPGDFVVEAEIIDDEAGPRGGA